MNFREWCEIKSNPPEVNMLPKGTTPEEAYSVLTHYLLGDDWYVIGPMGAKQVNTEIVGEIMLTIPSAKYRSYPWYKRLWINLKCLFTNDHVYNYY
jgi:hypothetical protein